MVIVPLFITHEEAGNIKQYLKKYAWDDTQIDTIGLHESIAVNSRSEAGMAEPEFIDLTAKAERDGYDAVISYCYLDVGVGATKSVKIPVIGPLEVSAAVANMLGLRFSIISVGATYPPGEFYIVPRLRTLGLDKNYASTRGIPFEKFFVFSKNTRHTKTMLKAIMEECKKALNDGAHVLILGCTGFPLARELGKRLKVPIIDARIALKIAEALVDQIPNKRNRDVQYSIVDQEQERNTLNTRIKLLVPTSNALDSYLIERLRKFVNEGTEIDVTSFENGPKFIQSSSDVTGVVPFVIREAARAEREGYDAVVIASFVDPGLESAREICRIPVIGLGESSILLSCILGTRISIITYKKWLKPLMEKTMRRIGLEKRISSVVLKPSQTEAWPKLENLAEEIKKITEEGVEVIILAETNASEIIQSIRDRIQVPVLDPMSVALKMAEVFHYLDLSHSKLSYPDPILPAYHQKRLRTLKRKPTKSMFLYGLGH